MNQDFYGRITYFPIFYVICVFFPDMKARRKCDHVRETGKTMGIVLGGTARKSTANASHISRCTH